MKPRRLSMTGNLIVAGALLFACSARAQTWKRYDAQPGSKVRLEGASTMHDWSVESKIVGGYMELDSNFPLDTSAGKVPDLKVVPKVKVAIPVRSLKSGKSLMDSVMYNALKQEEHPKIEYELLSMKSKNEDHKPGAPLQFEATGLLMVSGVTRTNSMPVSIEPLDKTKLKVTGNTSVKMTDFGISPPAPKIALGAIKTGDDVKIFFEWLIAQKTESASVEKAK